MADFNNMDVDDSPINATNQSGITNQTLDLKKFFSVETAASKIMGKQTPSTFMRRSFDLDNLYMKDGETKTQGFCKWIVELYKMNIDQVRTVCNYDAYIYVYYLRMSAVFFAILSVFNIVCLYVYHFVGYDHNPTLTALQRMTILSMFGCKIRVL